MSPTGAARFCSCGTRLASDNRTSRCGACRKKNRERFLQPPAVPSSFWDHPEVRAALASRHFGRALRAYRAHPFHGGRPLAQGVVANWLRLTQSQLSRIENGKPVQDLDRLIDWARLLHIPEHLLWFRLPSADPAEVARPARLQRPILSQPPTQPLPQLPSQLVSAGRLDDLAAMLSLRAADRQIGGGYLYATVASYLQHQVAPRLFGSSGDSDERRVFVAAAALTEMAGWMAHDVGRDAPRRTARPARRRRSAVLPH
jgi:transcriptional regulator with XRE-family HTH domain